MASGLAAAHAQGLIHRDIKPANILLEHNVERVKLTDFGLARAADDAGLTQSGTLTGTPQYMAPEQARGEALDHRADLFSLGSVLYAMCTSRAPFRAATTLAVLRLITEEGPPSVRQINPAVPAWLADVVAILQAKDPARRFASAAEVADLLGRYLAHLQHPGAAPRPPALPSGLRAARPRRRRWLLAAACLLGLLGAGLFALPRESEPEPPNRFYQSFRGLPIDTRLFRHTGPNARRQMREEWDGLRITLPAAGEEAQPTGLVANFRVSGDFEITTSYELLKADKPASGFGVGVQLYLMMESFTREAVLLGRFNTPDQGDVYQCGRMTTSAEGKRRYINNFHRAATRAGRLRLVRREAVVTCLVAEADGDEFRPIQEFELGKEDINLIRVAADSGHSDSPIDVRIGDFEVRALGIPAVVSPDAPRWRRALLYLVSAFAIASGLAGGVWLWRRRRFNKTAAKLVAPVMTKPQAPATAPRSKGIKKDVRRT